MGGRQPMQPWPEVKQTLRIFPSVWPQTSGLLWCGAMCHGIVMHTHRHVSAPHPTHLEEQRCDHGGGQQLNEVAVEGGEEVQVAAGDQQAQVVLHRGLQALRDVTVHSITSMLPREEG